MKPNKINHIALGVTDMQAALDFWQEALGLTLERMEEVPAEKARVAFFPIGDTEIELVQPTADDTGLAAYLEKRGPGMHHICVEVDDIEGMIAQLVGKGVQMINEEAKTRADGKKYAFIHPKSTHGVLVELYQLVK
jgi:methylmalonyl-CoA/ethylmalonyl-CoA epimerase